MRGQVAEAGLIGLTRAVTGARAVWSGCAPDETQRIYYANHASHSDLLLIWSALPKVLRRTIRPVAGADYWLKTTFRRFIAEKVFYAALIERDAASRSYNPLTILTEILDAGKSIIVFPEGTRNMTDEPLLPFKSGLYRLAKARPGIDLVPVWLDNPHRVMPKGVLLPVPFLCSATFGTPLRLGEGEERGAFVERARQALLTLAPQARRTGAASPLPKVPAP